MTDNDEGDGRLVIRLTYGEPLVSPEGWPPRFSPKPGETLAAFWDRDIVGDSFLQFVTPRTSRRPVPPLDGWHPADLTLAWWENKWPYEASNWPWAEELPRNYHRDRVYWRLGVGLFSQLRDGDLVMKAHRTDAAYPLEVVEPGWWQNPFMTLRPHAPGGGWFRPEKWRGSEPPPGPPWYRELTLWPTKAAETKQKNRPRLPYPKLLHWWTTEYLPRYPESDKRPNVETQRTDAAAAFPDYSPPTERTMQTLRAAKATPPEWRDVGRRPNSD